MKLPYYASLGKAVKANLQGGRGGACTSYFSCFDPEVMTLIMLQNPRTTRDKQNRDIHFAIMFNRLFAVKVAKNEDIFTFNTKTAPDLVEAFFSSDSERFETLYKKYDADPMFMKNYVSARKILTTAGQQSFDVATLYFMMIDEVNRHTSFLETIYSSNLCAEVVQPTKPYMNMMDLYSEEDHGRGEISLCSLAAINVAAVKSDAEYASVAYYALRMIDKCIHMSDYVLPHVKMTALSRMNAAVGMIGVATNLAKIGANYDSQQGRDRLHFLAERHAYHLISQSLRLSKEFGVAPWMHKTKWAKGWLPIDTYKKSVDELVTVGLKYDWESLREDIIANKGIRNSSLISHMPAESSSKASGATNSVYPIRDTALKKTDAYNAIDWCAIDGDIYGDQYQSAWVIDSVDMLKGYAVLQKFADQAISADLYRDRTVNLNITTDEIINTFLTMVKYGVKTRYYQNSLTSKEKTDNDVGIPTITEDEEEIDLNSEERGCAGSCTL